MHLELVLRTGDMIAITRIPTSPWGNSPILGVNNRGSRFTSCSLDKEFFGWGTHNTLYAGSNYLHQQTQSIHCTFKNYIRGPIPKPVQLPSQIMYSLAPLLQSSCPCIISLCKDKPSERIRPIQNPKPIVQKRPNPNQNTKPRYEQTENENMVMQRKKPPNTSSHLLV